jgi:hypothetical protein
MDRRAELLAAAVGATRALGDDDQRAYFKEYKAMQIENCSADDRPLWESITWDEVSAQLGFMGAELRVVDQQLTPAQVTKIESLLGPRWRDCTGADLLAAIVDAAAAEAGIHAGDAVGTEVVKISKALVLAVERGEPFNTRAIAVALSDLYGSPEEMPESAREAARYVLGRLGVDFDL